MSVGHPHRTPSKLAHTRELHKLLLMGGAPSLMKRWVSIETQIDCPYTCGYNVAGTTLIADQDFVKCLKDPAFAEHLLGAAIDTGLTPQQTLHCCFFHERIEKVLLDADNPIDHYPDAHEFASAGEDEEVTRLGSTPLRYNRGLERIIKHCQSKQLHRVRKDYCCAPALDDPDSTDLRILKRLRELGVTDAFKLAKKAVNYGRSHGADRCPACTMWKAPRSSVLSPCSLVEGLVRADRICDRYEPMHTAPPLDQHAHARWRSARLQRPVQHRARA